ncbi:LLM class flavin-dependent oxidoreductase [Roseomonas terrae]|uniref:LLM class flavin-dependent oxidoreductase n=1 Tax=Neoroseomonas terrae TaxID=424799 RepID=A0ABS5EQ76_9PROT|nr:LLM class flavin-dependent oxidoreductase [Neoroseomonas terrae]
MLDPGDPRLIIGLFMPTMSWGQWPSTARTTSEWTYDYNRRITVLAEEIGLHFVLPPARWKGMQGDRIEFWGASLDTMTLVGALAEATSRIALMTTIHTNLIHPVVAAKICAGLDQISNGRLILNVVSGWNEDEFRSMNIDLLEGRRDRYAYTQEWLQIVRELWATGRCTFTGEYFKICDAAARPLPVQKPAPLIVNAGQSFTGMSFAAREADYLFTRSERAEKWRGIVAASGRKVGYVALQRILLRETDAEAEALRDEIAENCDLGIMRKQFIARGMGSAEEADQWLAKRENIEQAVFEGAFVGGPDKVANELAAFVAASRPNGLCLTLYDYLPELALFGQEVLPRLNARLKKLGMEVAPPPGTYRGGEGSIRLNAAS